MKRFSMLLAIGVLLLTAGCFRFRTPVRPPAGLLVTSYKAPLTTNVHENKVSKKRGESSTYYFHDILLTGMDFGWDEASIEEAAQAGELSKVEYADYEVTSVLGIWGRFTIVAYGE